MKKNMFKVMMAAALALAVSGCVAIRDSIPIMGESEDGKQVVIANATRTRLYTLSKAAEKVELWEVSSDKGVKMKGSDANSDSTAAVRMLERGLELGAQVAAARMGVAVQQASQSAKAAAAPPATSSTPLTVTDADSSAPDQKEAKTVGGTGTVSVVVLGDRASCSLCRALWSYLDPAALSASLCAASVVDADRTDAPAAFGKYRPTSGFQYPLVRVYDGGTLKGEFVARGLDQKTLTAKVSELAPACRGT